MNILVTGGAGFIGTNLVNRLLKDGHTVRVIDKLTYASNKEVIIKTDFFEVDLAVHPLHPLLWHRPDVIFHLAAESHVDNSINGPEVFVDSNIIGTFKLLEAIRDTGLNTRFIHVSTDEVYGAIPLESDRRFREGDQYLPSSPYSATKASSDLLVKSWVATYGLNAVVTNCGNNYGPWQHSEKLIPTIINSIKNGKPVPIYGTGQNVRDWIHVDDHASALIHLAKLDKFPSGESFCIGANNPLNNLEIFNSIDAAMFNLGFRPGGMSFVADRPGHDSKYALDSSKLINTGWSPKIDFKTGIENTVKWYVESKI